MSLPSSTARFEFRIFGQRFTHWHHRIVRLSKPVAEQFWSRQSSEIYILSALDQPHNVKLCNGLPDADKDSYPDAIRRVIGWYGDRLVIGEE